MKTVFRQFVTGWNLLKVLKVGLAGMSIVAGIQWHDIALAIAGSGFLLFALLVNGTCCYHYNPKAATDQTGATDRETIKYEELGGK